MAMESVKKLRSDSGSIERRDELERGDGDSSGSGCSEAGSDSGSESSIDPTMVIFLSPHLYIDYKGGTIN